MVDSTQIFAIIICILLVLSIIFVLVGLYQIFSIGDCSGYVWSLIYGVGIGFFAVIFASIVLKTGAIGVGRRF